jgi:aspartate-semialdehyde dehydrogenase
VYPHPIAFNVLPHIDVFDESGYTGEERKVADETRKMMGLPDLRVSATCVRVPVLYAHSQAVHIETTDAIDAEQARRLLMGAPGVVLVDEPAQAQYPLPREAAGRDEVFVGRIRRDASHPRGLALWVVSDNLRKGAATNAVQIAESLVQRGWL